MPLTFFRASNSRFFGLTALLVAADATVTVLACLVAIGFRFGLDVADIERVFGTIEPRVVAFTFWIVVGMLSMGLYRPRQRPTTEEMIARVILAVIIGTIGNILFFFFLPDIFGAGRGVIALAAVLACVGLIASRMVLLRIIDMNPVKRRVLVIGTGEHAMKIRNLRRRSDRRRFDVVAFVVATESERELAAEIGIGPIVDEPEARLYAFDEIVVALDDRRGALPMDFLLEFKQRGIPVTDLVDFLERETEYLDLDILRPSWLLYERSSETDMIYRWLKRGIDIVISLALLILVSPLLMLAALAIKVEDGPSAPIFYRQKRVGQHGKIVRLLKLRSMRINAERGTGPRWSSKGDSRVTQVGWVLRRFRIDELPQMINIIRGDMSVVGPRPERPEFVELLSREVPLYYYRHGVRPGLTGWAQLNYPYGASVDDSREKLKYDLYYIKNASLILDILILLQTAEVVVWGRATTMAGGARPGVQSDRMETNHRKDGLAKPPPESDVT
ncbi:MAG: TIGR03013 family PEP-CTERM/XrtA system glycosyltransferase [Gammaproteobacteria bacterium]|nr:TIGR03013 family PEP-CTERM/XrtA system glycosyltransferase [Gammaproteobacteria bacterium]